MVPIPILVAVNTPTVEKPETLSEVTDAIPLITFVAVVAKPTLIFVEALESKLKAVVANDAVDAAPIKLPKKVTVPTPEDVIIPALITTALFPEPTVTIPEILEFPTTKSSDVGFVVPIPILVAVNIPTVENPETLSWVNDPIPPLTLVAVVAKPTLIFVEALESKLKAVWANPADDAVPTKLPTKVTVLKPGLEEVTIPVTASIFTPVNPAPTVAMPLTLKFATLRFVWVWPPSLSTPFAPI